LSSIHDELLLTLHPSPSLLSVSAAVAVAALVLPDSGISGVDWSPDGSLSPVQSQQCQVSKQQYTLSQNQHTYGKFTVQSKSLQLLDLFATSS
jgi:hypothetical protein